MLSAAELPAAACSPSILARLVALSSRSEPFSGCLFRGWSPPFWWPFSVASEFILIESKFLHAPDLGL